MFFALSKIVWAVIAPLNLIFLLLMLGAAISFFSKALGRSILVLGMFLFAVCGGLPLGAHLLASLENDYQRPAVMPERVHGILVLGGASETVIAHARETLALNESAERMVEAAGLAQRYPQAIVVFSGGNGHLLHRERTEAEDVALFLETLQMPAENVIFEDESRNTYENIRFSRTLVLPQPEETWMLVTSAFHMPRAVAVARASGWQVIPYPVDYRTVGGEPGWLPDRFNLLENFHDLHVAWREYIGLVAYHLSGKISLTVR